MGECTCMGLFQICSSYTIRAEAAIALRQRLNETVDQLDALRNAHTELEVKFENQSKELTIAKSDRKHLSVHLRMDTDAGSNISQSR